MPLVNFIISPTRGCVNRLLCSHVCAALPLPEYFTGGGGRDAGGEVGGEEGKKKGKKEEGESEESPRMIGRWSHAIPGVGYY